MIILLLMPHRARAGVLAKAKPLAAHDRDASGDWSF